MARHEGALARQLDFGDEDVSSACRTSQYPGASLPGGAQGARAGLRLAVPSAILRGPDKYRLLEHRRRQAQIKARKAMDAAEQLNFEC